MKTLTTKATTMTVANAIASQWIKAGLIFDSRNQAVGFALRKVAAIKAGRELIFPWETKVLKVAESVKTLLVTFITTTGPSKVCHEVVDTSGDLNPYTVFKEVFGVNPKWNIFECCIGVKTQRGHYWACTEELARASKVLKVTLPSGSVVYYYAL